LRKASEMDKKTPHAHFALGRLYEWQKRYPEAEKVLLEGLKLNEKSWQGHFSLGHVYWTWATGQGRATRRPSASAKARSCRRPSIGGNILMKGAPAGKRSDRIQRVFAPGFQRANLRRRRVGLPRRSKQSAGCEKNRQSRHEELIVNWSDHGQF